LAARDPHPRFGAARGAARGDPSAGRVSVRARRFVAPKMSAPPTEPAIVIANSRPAVESCWSQ
jgi:hypothetical protein